MLKFLISILSTCLLIYLPLFLYTQIAEILYRINAYGYTLADHEAILEGIPVWKLKIPFAMEIRRQFEIRPFMTVLIGTSIIGFLIVAFAGGYISKRFKTGYDRKSYSHLMSRLQRKRGLCRIEYTATKRFNVYGGKGLVTRHTPRVLLETVFRPLYILQNRIAEEYNWPRRRWWNLQKARVVSQDRERAKTQEAKLFE